MEDEFYNCLARSLSPSDLGPRSADCLARSPGFDQRGHVFFVQKDEKEENKRRTLLSGYYVGEGLVLFYFLFFDFRAVPICSLQFCCS
jgi:hypothetical protein